jgi:hypothetical protein
MRILLDECVDERLRHFFHEHDCQTARFAGFAGLKNGALLIAAEAAGFEVIVTVDQPHSRPTKSGTPTDLISDPVRSNKSPTGSEVACPCRA